MSRAWVFVVALVCVVSVVVSASAETGDVTAHKKISEDSGGFEGQLGVADGFGSSLAALGDLDGDGKLDVAVGAPGSDGQQGADEGAFWILFLRSDGGVDTYEKFSPGVGPLAVSGARLGSAVANIGDLDGDGTVDLAVGAPNDPSGGLDRGLVWIVFLDDDGTVEDVERVDGFGSDFDGDLDAGDEFGKSVAGIGDLDGDGVPDLAVGAPGDDDGGFDRGAVWILFMDDDGLVHDYQKISDKEGGFAGKLESIDRFGSSVAAIGDVDGDGVVDLVVGAPFDDDGGGENLGAVWILFMNTNGTVKGEFLISKRDDVLSATLNRNDNFGASVAGIGDFDEDGVPDISVGAPFDDDGSGEDRGAFYNIFLNADGSPKSEVKISDTAGGFTGNLRQGDGFGSALAAIGDLDGDGTTDLMAGAPRDDDGDGIDSGAAWTLFMEGPQVLCGDADLDASVDSTDALIMLYVSVGSAFCDLCVCDVNSSGSVTVTDAQLTLAASVGTPIDLVCPACQ